MASVLTTISLPRGRRVSEATSKEILRLVLTEFGWIRPVEYGKHEADKELPHVPVEKQIDHLTDFIRDRGTLGLRESRSIRFNLAPPQPNLPIGDIVWEAPPSHPGLRLEKHRDAVWRLMTLVQSPLAEAMTVDEKKSVTYRFVPTPTGEEQLLTVRGYWEGLRHAFWRMWFGRPYVQFFGRDRLEEVPAYHSAPLDPDGFFIQVREKPDTWNTPEAQRAALALKSALNPRAFYDATNPEAVLETPTFE